MRTAQADLVAESDDAIVLRLDGNPRRKVGGRRRRVVVYAVPVVPDGEIVATLRALADRIEGA